MSVIPATRSGPAAAGALAAPAWVASSGWSGRCCTSRSRVTSRECGLFCGVGLISRGVGFYREHLHNRGLAGVPGIALTWCVPWAVRPCGPANRPPAHRPGGRAAAGRQGVAVPPGHHPGPPLFGLRPFWGDRHGPLRYTAVRSRTPLLRLLPQLGRGRAHPLGTAAQQLFFRQRPGRIRLFLDSPLALDGELFTPRPRPGRPYFTGAGGYDLQVDRRTAGRLIQPCRAGAGRDPPR